jgi:pSer/pThr/pTyr-binding forkhead associated (FHA) protein
MENIEVRAFVMPERYRVDGKNKAPVVVMLDQGATPAGNGSDENALAPVGALVIGADDSFRPNTGRANFGRDKGGDDKRLPVRIFHLVDASPSMKYDSGAEGQRCSKLNLVKRTISRLAVNLPQGIKHVLIPYSDELHNDDAGTFDNPNDLVQAIQQLSTRGGTDIGVPIAEALRQIQNNPNNPEGIEYRNLINLISDGQADPTEPLSLALKYPRHNAGAFSLGVGTDYNESLMQGVVSNAGFGGFAHIPQTGTNQNIDIFGQILPNFVRQMMSAPYYPVLKFNKWFDSVINMTPSTREVGVDHTEANKARFEQDFFKYRAAVGYQNRGFVVGFIDETKLDDAKVALEINESASKDPLEIQDLKIEAFDSLGLDPNDIELLRNAPLEALKMQIIKERDPAKITRFIKDNPDIDSAFKKRLEELANQLQRFASNDNVLMSVGSHESYTFQSRAHGGQQGSGDNPSLSGAFKDTKDARDYDDTRVATNPAQRAVSSDGQTSNEKILRFTPNSPEYLMLKEGTACNEFSIKPNQELTFGRNLSNDIVLSSQFVSRDHGRFLLKDGELYIQDLSSNGTEINSQRIPSNQYTRVVSGDTIKIGPLTFVINFD